MSLVQGPVHRAPPSLWQVLWGNPPGPRVCRPHGVGAGLSLQAVWVFTSSDQFAPLALTLTFSHPRAQGLRKPLPGSLLQARPRWWSTAGVGTGLTASLGQLRSSGLSASPPCMVQAAGPASPSPAPAVPAARPTPAVRDRWRGHFQHGPVLLHRNRDNTKYTKRRADEEPKARSGQPRPEHRVRPTASQ